MMEPIWPVPPPSPEMHRRIIEAGERELTKRTRAQRLSGGLALTAVVIAAVMAMRTDLHRTSVPMTGFYSLMDAPPPLGNGMLVRTMVPESALAIAGIPVPDGHAQDSIEADLIVGEDGIPRAIRFPGY
jgi:hypothetical protein